jgi:hypothetical protein
VLGLSLRPMLSALSASAHASGWDAQNCFVTDACLESTKAAQHRAAAPAAEALARRAATTRDPQTYASAMRACRFIDARASVDCSALRAEQWAQLDPDNAFAWFEVAAAARSRRDYAANDEALRRASRAKVIDWRGTPFDEVMAHLEIPSETIRALVLAQLSAAYFSEERFAQYGGLGRYCLSAATDVERRNVCGDLARILTERDPGLVGMQWGTSLSSWAQWAPEPRRAVHAELVLLETLRTRALPSADSLSCNWAEQTTQWLQSASKLGETGYLRQLAREQKQQAASGKSAGQPPR